jgi:hypothetical protein
MKKSIIVKHIPGTPLYKIRYSDDKQIEEGTWEYIESVAKKFTYRIKREVE